MAKSKSPRKAYQPKYVSIVNGMRVHKKPKLADELHVFENITLVLDKLESGEIDTIDDQMVVVLPGELAWQEVQPALAGWISLWDRIGKHFSIRVQMDGLKLLHSMLVGGEELLPEHIELCRREVELQRQIFRNHERKELMSLANTETISLYMEGIAA